ncbi:MAG TPA: ATP-binding cassette domain-containing protein [Candidatus Dormibacteraeota bacterium]|jgi:ABC-2 type transport system ATP-binding protein|nr:ATP-binding cassette domain-containing protein [Candidatus Dormibacteraeota bacterium]
MQVLTRDPVVERHAGDDDPIISVRSLVKRYGAIEAVRGIDLEVRRGEIFGFLGPNGAGKSTTISILCTLLRATEGSAVVAGRDVARDPHAVRQRIGLIFQDPSLDDQLTARENLQFHAMVYGVPRAGRRRRIDDALRTVELTERAESPVRTFSGGMRRRLEIARGILHTPEVLFLDEPTQGLDPQTRANIWEHLQKLRRERDLTMFMTTHYMDEAEYCDRIAIIDHGRIVALGTPEELKAMVGGDVVTLSTDDDRRAAAEIDERLSVEAAVDGTGLHIEVADGAAFVPRLIAALTVPVRSVTVRRPSLDDVFIKLTGRAIRDAEATATDGMRRFAQAFGGRRR